MQHLDKPLVSIGLPVYNGEKYIRRALDSLLAQEYPHFELIISDNASTDRTGEICREYARNDKRIRYNQLPANMGALWNFRHTLELATGPYFMWAAHDDGWKPEFVRVLLEELECHPEAGVAMSATELVGEDGRLLKTIRFDNHTDPNPLSHYQLLLRLLGWNAPKAKYNLYIYGLFRKELLSRAIKHYEDTFLGDRIFICQMALATRFRYVDRPLYVRTEHAISVYKRYPEEKFSQVAYGALYKRLEPALRLGRMIILSDIIPLRRKLYVPMAMWGMLRLLMRAGKPA